MQATGEEVCAVQRFIVEVVVNELLQLRYSKSGIRRHVQVGDGRSQCKCALMDSFGAGRNLEMATKTR